MSLQEFIDIIKEQYQRCLARAGAECTNQIGLHKRKLQPLANCIGPPANPAYGNNGRGGGGGGGGGLPSQKGQGHQGCNAKPNPWPKKFCCMCG